MRSSRDVFCRCSHKPHLFWQSAISLKVSRNGRQNVWTFGTAPGNHFRPCRGCLFQEMKLPKVCLFCWCLRQVCCVPLQLLPAPARSCWRWKSCQCTFCVDLIREIYFVKFYRRHSRPFIIGHRAKILLCSSSYFYGGFTAKDRILSFASFYCYNVKGRLLSKYNSYLLLPFNRYAGHTKITKHSRNFSLRTLFLIRRNQFLSRSQSFGRFPFAEEKRASRQRWRNLCKLVVGECSTLCGELKRR